MKLLRLQGVGSAPGFWLVWTLASIVAAACMYLPPDALLRWLGVPERLNRYLRLLYLSQLVLFWLVAAGGQEMVLRRLLPRGRRWGFLTFIGGVVATMSYTVAGSVLAPMWTEFIGVQVRPFGVPLFFIRPNYLQETLFIALQGAVFGGLLAFFSGYGLALWLARQAVPCGAIGFCRRCLVRSRMVCRRHSDDDVDQHPGIVFRAVGLSVPVPPLLWIAYSVLTGIALRYAIKRWSSSVRDAITSAFD